MKYLAKIASYFRFWNLAVLWCFTFCVVAIAIRQGFKPYLPAEVRSVLKQLHIIFGELTVVCVIFHGLGHSKFLVRYRQNPVKK